MDARNSERGGAGGRGNAQQHVGKFFAHRWQTRCSHSNCNSFPRTRRHLAWERHRPPHLLTGVVAHKFDCIIVSSLPHVRIGARVVHGYTQIYGTCRYCSDSDIYSLTCDGDPAALCPQSDPFLDGKGRVSVVEGRNDHKLRG